MPRKPAGGRRTQQVVWGMVTRVLKPMPSAGYAGLWPAFREVQREAPASLLLLLGTRHSKGARLRLARVSPRAAEAGRRPAYLYLSGVDSGGSLREVEWTSSRRGCGSCGKPACRFSKVRRETVCRFPRGRQLPQPRPPVGFVSGLPESLKEGRQAARSDHRRTVLRAPCWDLCPGCFAALDAQWRVSALEHQYRYGQATRHADQATLPQGVRRTR